MISLYLRNPPLKEIHQRVFSTLLKGEPLNLFTSEAKKFVDHWLEKELHPIVYARFLEAKKRGERNILLSSSPDFIVGEIAARLGFDDWKGTQYRIDKEGRLCEIASLIEGNAKLEWAKQIRCTSISAYSDSEDDRALLNWADEAIAVQPDKGLQREALARNWEVIL